MNFIVALVITIIYVMYHKTHSKKQKVYHFTAPSGKVESLFLDALSQPHLLIAGATGSGKSVIENGLIDTLMYRLPFDQRNGAQLILIDPKGNELHKYEKLPHTLRYAYQPNEMISALQYAMDITMKRFQILRSTGDDYYNGSDVFIFIDEFADLMTTQGKTVKPIIQRLCQLGRAARVHVIICTQTPIAKVIPTEIKCNFDARFGLRTRSNQDSRNIIGKSGLELLPKFGQGIYMTPDEESLYNIPYITKDEIRKNLSWWADQMEQNRNPRRKAA